MKKGPTIVLLLAIFTGSVLLYSCGSEETESGANSQPSPVVSQQSAIVGKWKRVGGGKTVEFFQDGTVSMSDGGSGKYSFPDGKHIYMDGGIIRATLEYEVSGNRLTWKAPGSSKEEFDKM